MPRKAAIAIVVVVTAGLAVSSVLRDGEKETPITLDANDLQLGNSDHSLMELAGPPERNDVLDRQIAEQPSEDTNAQVPESELASEREAENDPRSFFFVTEEDYRRLAIYWYLESERYGKAWTARLEEELSKDDSAPNSSNLERAAASAVTRDSLYSYEPLLSVSDLEPKCRNYVCKVQIPASVRVSSDLTSAEMRPGSNLNSYEYNLFSHGFSHHFVIQNLFTDTTVHWLLGNGIELDDSTR